MDLRNVYSSFCCLFVIFKILESFPDFFLSDKKWASSHAHVLRAKLVRQQAARRRMLGNVRTAIFLVVDGPFFSLMQKHSWKIHLPIEELSWFLLTFKVLSGEQYSLYTKVKLCLSGKNFAQNCVVDLNSRLHTH